MYTDDLSVEEQLAADPDLAYVLDDPEDEEQEQDNESPRGGGEDKRPKTPADVLDEPTRRIIDRLKENPDLLDRLRETPSPTFVREQTPAPRQEQPPTFNPDDVAARFESDFLNPEVGPKGAIKNLIAGMAPIAQSFQRQALDGSSNANLAVNRMAISREIDRLRNDPSFGEYSDDVIRYMEQKVERVEKENPGAVARMTSAEIRENIDALANEAYGVAARSRNKPRRETAPNYGRTASVGGRAESVRGRENDSVSLSQDERDFCRSLDASLRASGLTEKEAKAEVRQALKEYRAENRRSA